MAIIYIYVSVYAHLKSRTAFMRQLRAVSFFFALKIHIIYIMRVYCFQTAGGLFSGESPVFFSRRKKFLWRPRLRGHSLFRP